MTIGEAMKEARIKKEYSQNQLSIKSGVLLLSISKYERGETFPNILNLISIADALGVTLDELVGRKVNKNDTQKV